MYRTIRAASRAAPRAAVVLATGLAVLASTGCNNNAPVTPSTDRMPSVGRSPSSTPAPAPVSSTGTATLRWAPPTQTTDGQPLSDLGGYRVYYGQLSIRLDRWITISNPSETSATVTGLSAGTWFFAVTAFTRQGVESSMSNVVSKAI